MVSFDMIDSDEVYLRRGECWVVDIVRKMVLFTDPCAKYIVYEKGAKTI